MKKIILFFFLLFPLTNLFGQCITTTHYLSILNFFINKGTNASAESEELGISERTVKNQISNAIGTLKTKLGDSLNIFVIFF